MDVRHLELLRDLADRGTVTAVAAATHRTPSAVSQQLRTAERELGVRLVEPDGRRLRLTEAGRVVARGAEDVTAALARVAAALDRLRHAPAGTVSVGALPSAAEAFGPGLFRRLAETEVTVELTDFDVAEADFAPRVVDFDVVVGHSFTAVPTGAAGLSVRPLVAEPLDIALPADHRLATRATLTPSAVVDEPWIGVPPRYPFDDVRLAIERKAGRPMRVLQRVRDNRLVEAMVAAGMGLALLPRFTTRPRPGLITRPLTGVEAARTVVALSRPDRSERAAVRLVLDALVELGRELEAGAADLVTAPRRP